MVTDKISRNCLEIWGKLCHEIVFMPRTPVIVILIIAMYNNFRQQDGVGILLYIITKCQIY